MRENANHYIYRCVHVVFAQCKHTRHRCIPLDAGRRDFHFIIPPAETIEICSEHIYSLQIVKLSFHLSSCRAAFLLGARKASFIIEITARGVLFETEKSSLMESKVNNCPPSVWDSRPYHFQQTFIQIPMAVTWGCPKISRLFTFSVILNDLQPGHHHES